jgi:hypothetical protein
MYTVEIGRQFLNLYNQKKGKNYSALEFFEKEFFSLMFDSEDYLHLMHVHGSSFFQPSYSRLAKKENQPIPFYRKDKFLESVEAVSTGKTEPHGGVGVGFMAGGVEETTSGQVSTIDAELTEEKILYSWFGGALGIGLGGGYDFSFHNEDILWYLFKGWKYYRKYLDENTDVKGRQIETWNGLWILQISDYSDDLNQAYKEFHANLGNNTKKQGGKIKLKRPQWTEQVFALSQFFGDKNERELIYGYSYGQMNKTLGFMHLELKRVSSMADLFDQLIENDPVLSLEEKKRLQDVYEAQFSIEKACAQGGIGLKAMQPKNLYKYTLGGIKKKIKSLPKLEKKEKKITFFTYITWVQAMLKNEDTLQLAEEVAEALIKYEKGQERLTKRKNEVEELWQSYSRQQLIDKLAAIVDEEPKVAKTMNKAVDQLMTKIPQDMYRLFLTLVKFKYHYYQSN